MLVRLFEENYKEENDIYDDAKFLAAFKVNDYGEFVKMLTLLKQNDEEYHIAIGNEWYTLSTWVFNFPENGEILPCINVYVL